MTALGLVIQDVQFDDRKWLQFWENYKGLEHQTRAVAQLGKHIRVADPCLLCEGAEWVTTWRGSKDIENTWGSIEGAARRHGSKYPELVAAQWRLESGSGAHLSGKNNPFGLKGPGTTVQTEEVLDGKRVTIDASFIDFPSLDEAVRYLCQRWYCDWKQHRGVNNAPNRNEAARELQRQGYATEPMYAERLIAIMDRERPLANPFLSNPLSVPYQSQLDNASGKGYRECFSSSAAMLAMFHKKVVGDDAYNAVRAKYGDSTSAQAQLAALRSLGLSADFRTDGSVLDLRREIDAGRPVAVGWLHKGPATAPSGDGHWSVVIGYTDVAWIHNDPNGEAQLGGGGYTNNRNGAGVAYSRKNWEPRWRPGGSGGWYLTCRP